MKNINLHYNIAEQGKVYATKGNHKEALRHYKEALRMSQQVPKSDIFFQHYSQCAMESLEQMKAYNEVIIFCDKCIDFMETKDDLQAHPIFIKYLASLWERKAIQYLFLNEKEQAIEAFEQAIDVIKPHKLPLAQELHNWCKRGYTISKQQIEGLLKKNQYHTVRKENVNIQIALELPEMINPF
jgi:tetratricopeptide (TPR) repeat protein